MALSPPETARAKQLYRLAFVAICVASLSIIITIGVRQYRATAKAEATQKELQTSIGEIKKQLQSAEVSRRLTGEGYLQVKQFEAFPGTFLSGNPFRVNVTTHNPGTGRVTDPVTASWMGILDNVGDRQIQDKFEELARPYREEYLARKQPAAPEAMGINSTSWSTQECQLVEGDVEALRNDSKRLYVFTFYAWTDSQGRKVFGADCRYLQASTLPQDYQTADAIWQACVVAVDQ